MSARPWRAHRLSATILAAALATWAGAAGGALARAGAAGAAAGPRITLATAWGPTFWRALRNGSPMAFTPAGDAFVVAPGLGSDLQVIEELAPDGSVLWQTSAYQEIHSVRGFDGGRRIAFLALPMPSVRPYHLVLGILDPATGALSQTPIDYRAGGGLIAAGNDIVVTGGWPRSGFVATFDASGDLASALSLKGWATGFATPTGAEILATRGGKTAVWSVNGTSGAIRRTGAIPAEGPGERFLPLPAGGFVTFTSLSDASGFTLSVWKPGGAQGFREVWAWRAGHEVNGTYGVGVLSPSGALAALPIGRGVDVVRTGDGVVAASVTVRGYALRAVGAQGGGFIVLEVPNGPARRPRPDRLATFTWQGAPVETLTLPATADRYNEPLNVQTASVDGVVLTATSAAVDVAAVGAAAHAEAAPPPLPAALEAAPLTLGARAAPIASLAVLANGEVVDAAHPLVVTAAAADRAIPIEILGLNASGANVPAPGPDPFTVTDGGAGGRFLPAPQWGIPPGALGAALAYANPHPGRYVLRATTSNPAAQTPLFQLPRAVAAGATVPVTLHLPGPATRYAGQAIEITPVPGSDLASRATVTATPEAAGTYVATFAAGGVTGAAAFEATVPGRRIDLGQSPTLAVGAIAAPSVRIQPTVGGLNLTLDPGPTGDTPIGFVVTPADGGVPIVVPYLGRPATLGLRAAAPVSVTAVDADGAQSEPVRSGTG